MMSNALINPVLPGFHPDPSILRVGSDFYLATSTFVFLATRQLRTTTLQKMSTSRMGTWCGPPPSSQ